MKNKIKFSYETYISKYINGIYYTNNNYLELYKFDIPYYQNKLRQNIIK